jgi:hypothetical protein
MIKQIHPARLWIGVVVLLSLPCVVFAVTHALYSACEAGHIALPAWIDVLLTWTIAVTGIVGALFMLGALMVTAAGTLQPGVSTGVKIVMWVIFAISVVACAYLAQVAL